MGGPLYFPSDSLIAQTLLRTGQWEADVTRLLTVATRHDTVVMDVGANIGTSALSILDDKPSVCVYSFEPSPTVLPHLTRTRNESRFRDRWEVIAKAVTDQEGGDISFTVHLGGGADVYEGLRDTGRGAALTRQVLVPTTTIDTEWIERGRPPVSLIKIDVEGAEIGVFNGARQCLAACRPVIVTEWCPQNFVTYGCKPSDMFLAAESAGYDVFLIPELYPILADLRVLPYQLVAHENLLLLPKT